MKQRKYVCVGRREPVPALPTGRPVQVGDTVRKAPVSFSLVDYPGTHSPPQSGRVAWVHPKGRYYLVEFPVAQGVIRECFCSVGP